MDTEKELRLLRKEVAELRNVLSTFKIHFAGGSVVQQYLDGPRAPIDEDVISGKKPLPPSPFGTPTEITDGV